MPMSTACLMSDLTCGVAKHKFWKENAEKVCDDEEDIQGKIAIVTGSSSGIGKEIALQLAKRGAVVIMAVRNMEKGKQAMEEIQEKIGKDKKLELMKVDIGEMQSVREFAKEFQTKYSHLNILVNNAGILDNTGVLKTTKEGLEHQLAINHLGPFLLTRLLLDSLKNGAPSRVICVQSSVLALVSYDLEDLSKEPKLKADSANQGQYGISKVFNAMCMMKLGKSLEGQGVKIFNFDPGYVKTPGSEEVSSNMNPVMKAVASVAKGVVGITPHQCCETVIYLSVSKGIMEQEDTGKGEIYRFMVIWTKGNKILKEYDLDEKSDAVYKRTEEMVGLN